MHAMPPAIPAIVAQAAEIAHRSEGIELVKLVFETWDSWTGLDLNDKPICPGCGNEQDPSCLDASLHDEFCWFAQARRWLGQAQVEPSPLSP